MFGEAWERVFRLAAELDGNTRAAGDAAGEVIWRDMETTPNSRLPRRFAAPPPDPAGSEPFSEAA